MPLDIITGVEAVKSIASTVKGTVSVTTVLAG